MDSHVVGIQVWRHIHEDLIHAVVVYVISRDIAQVDFIDAGAVVQIKRHAGLGNYIGKSEGGICLKLVYVAGFSLKYMLRSLGLAETVGGLYFLYHLEEPCPARDTEGLDGGAGCQADGLFRPALICDHKGGSERIKTAFHTFHRGIEGLEVDGDVGFIHVCKSLIFAF